MKNFIKNFILIFFPILVFSQVGIGTISPDPSAVLDVFSNDRGILIPRVTTTNRNNITAPPEGLLLFNTTTKSINYFDSNWKDLSANYKSINSVGEITTNSSVAIDIPGIELVLNEGIYFTSFDSQITNINSSPPENIVNSDMLLADFFILYNQLNTYTTTNSTHASGFGNGEVVLPGKYSVSMAISVAGVLEFDGQGDANSLFIINANGAINFVANSTIVLTNGALPENIYWLSEGAIGIGAETIAYGNLISHGAAIAIGASCTTSGGMYTNVGAIAFGPGVCSVTTNSSSTINLGSLQTFVAFTGSGAINNTGNSIYNGNICTGAGDTSSLGMATINGIIVPPLTDVNLSTTIPATSFIATFSIYQNNILIPSSTKRVSCNPGFTNISLQGIANILDGESITVKWETDSETLTLGNRVLTAIKVK